MPDLSSLFAFEHGMVEMAVRGTVMYWGVLLLLRIVGRRDIGSLTIADILVLLLVADAISDAMSGATQSLSDALTIAAVLVGWSYVIDRAKYYIPGIGRVLEPRRLCLIRDGQLQLAEMRTACVSRGELFEQLRLKGFANIRDVHRAYLEAHGEISVIAKPALPPTDSGSTLQE